MFLPIKQAIYIRLFSFFNYFGSVLYSISVNNGSKVVYGITNRMSGRMDNRTRLPDGVTHRNIFFTSDLLCKGMAG